MRITGKDSVIEGEPAENVSVGDRKKFCQVGTKPTGIYFNHFSGACKYSLDVPLEHFLNKYGGYQIPTMFCPHCFKQLQGTYI